MHDVTTPAPVGSQLSRLFADPALGARRMTVPAGTVLFEPDGVADRVYYLHRGQVRLYQLSDGDERTARLVEILGPDEWFGVATLARSRTHDSRAIALVPSVLSEVRSERLIPALSHRPEMTLELNRQLAARLQASRDDAARLIFQNCNQRLLHTLLRFSRTAASTPRDDGVVLRITHDQLAQAIGVARETVSLALTQLRQKNVLRTGRNQLFFNPQVLRELGGRGGNGNTVPIERIARSASHSHPGRSEESHP